MIAPVTYSLLSVDRVEPTARAYTEVFVRDEPMTCRHTIDVDTFFRYARRYVHYCADASLSIIAEDTASSECAGFILCCDMATDISALEPEMAEFLSIFPDSVAIIDALEQNYLPMDMALPGTTLHIYQIGVRDNYRKQAVATNLIYRICDHAKDWDFRHIVADCTSPVSCHTFERCGFQPLGSIPYDSFYFNGRKFFSGLDGGISLVMREL